MSNAAVRMDNVSVYYGQTPALTDVCLEVQSGEYLGIIGPNGGGKSTLLKAILGLVKISGGSVEVFGRPVKSGISGIGYVPQFADMDKNTPSVREVVLTGRCGPASTLFSGSRRRTRNSRAASSTK